jgi:hypothetical protein
MNKLFYISAAVLSFVPGICLAQNGSDVDQAIPIYFGQTVNGSVDGSTTCCQVYSLTMAKSQQITITAKATGASPAWNVCLNSPNVTTILKFDCVAGNSAYSGQAAVTYNYTAAAAGTYFLEVFARANNGVSYTLQVTAPAGILQVPNPPKAGCLSGQVDSITYSLQLISAELPDAVSIGAAVACATCSVKPPSIPALVKKMESAMAQNVGVSACYDASGNIFELTLNHP